MLGGGAVGLKLYLISQHEEILILLDIEMVGCEGTLFY